jgi:hypothetical protein
MLFLVTGIVERKQYPDTRTLVTTESRLVEAKDEYEAAHKFDIYFEAKNDEYCVSYTTWDVYAHEVIQ